MIYDRHPELQSKWNKAFWARGYYVETIGNITDEAVQKYIKEQAYLHNVVIISLTSSLTFPYRVFFLYFGMNLRHRPVGRAVI